MMWVKLTLASPVRASWLLRTRRFTSRSRAGTTRKLVAVGTLTLASMLAAMRAAAPRSGTPSDAAAPGRAATVAGDVAVPVGGDTGQAVTIAASPGSGPRTA